MVLCPHAHAKINSIDTSAAESMPGVKAVDIIHPVGQEVLWMGKEIVAVAAETDDQARDAVRAVKIDYEVMPYLVTDAAPENAQGYTQQLNEQTQLDPDAGFKLADAIHEGNYGVTVITHCCMESHGSAAEWNGDNLTVWASTQSVTGLTQEYSSEPNLERYSDDGDECANPDPCDGWRIRQQIPGGHTGVFPQPCWRRRPGVR